MNRTHEIEGRKFWIEESIYGWGWSDGENRGEKDFATEQEAYDDAVNWLNNEAELLVDIEGEKEHLRMLRTWYGETRI